MYYFTRKIFFVKTPYLCKKIRSSSASRTMSYSKKSTRDAIIKELVDASLNIVNSCTGSLVTEREREIVSLYLEDKTFEDIGIQMNLSSEGVRRIIYGIISKMQSFENIYDDYQNVKARNEALKKELSMLRYAKSKLIGNDEKPVDGIRLIDCNLPIRILKPLNEAYPDVKTIYDLAQLTKKDLLAINRLGRTSIKEIQQLLGTFSYTLRK